MELPAWLLFAEAQSMNGEAQVVQFMADPLPLQRFENVSAAVIIDCLLQIFRVTGEENDVGLAVYGSELSGQPEPVHMIIQFYIQKSDGYNMVLRELQCLFPSAEAGDAHARELFLQHADGPAKQKRDIFHDDDIGLIL